MGAHALVRRLRQPVGSGGPPGWSPGGSGQGAGT
jgi:hypothetical protein